MRLFKVIAMLVLAAACTAANRHPNLMVLNAGSTEEVLEVKEWFRQHHFMELSVPARVLHIGSLMASLFVATTAKYAVLKTVWMTGPLSRPINIIIILEQAVIYVAWCVMWAIILVYEVTEVPMAKVFDERTCEAVAVFAFFGGFYNVSSGFAAATFRFMYLQWPEAIKTLGDWTVMWIIFGLTMTFHTFAVYKVKARGYT